MRIAILGGGPAGLYFAYLWKTRHPRDEIELFEQNAADATFGFGVVFSERALDFMREDDPDTVDAIMPHMETWRDIKLVHRGEETSSTASVSRQSAGWHFCSSCRIACSAPVLPLIMASRSPRSTSLPLSIS
jgi:2-polyprenyl-6-methoxyphenol hydroxylase-like FAD-dependent oxidoreductase